MARPERDDDDTDIDYTALDAQLKTNRLLVMGLAVTSIVFLLGALGVLFNLGQKVSEIPDDPLANLQTDIETLDERYANLELQIENHLKAVEKLEGNIEKMDVKSYQQQVRALQGVLVRQEKDFQYFLSNLNGGLSNLAGMLRGPKSWREEFGEKMQAAIERSDAREQQIKDL